MANPLKGRKRKPAEPKSFLPSNPDKAPMSFKPPTLKERITPMTDSLATSILGEHPMLKSLKPRIAKAVMDVARKHATVSRV